MQILVVEDEPKVGNALREGLEAEGYGVTLAQTGEEGFFQASAHTFDLVILDVMLPGRDGIEVLNTLRKQGARTLCSYSLPRMRSRTGCSVSTLVLTTTW